MVYAYLAVGGKWPLSLLVLCHPLVTCVYAASVTSLD